MSLEAAVQENTKALRELITAIGQLGATGRNTTAATSPSAPTAATAQTTPEPGESAPAALDFAKDLAPPFQKLYAKDPNAASKIVADLGVGRLSLAPRERWQEALDAINAALGV
jgi:hypothetical protein